MSLALAADLAERTKTREPYNRPAIHNDNTLQTLGDMACRYRATVAPRALDERVKVGSSDVLVVRPVFVIVFVVIL